MNIKKTLAIISLFSTLLLANEATNMLNLAKEFEINGDIQNAMKYYKKAALFSIKPDDNNYIKEENNNSLVTFGSNDIEKYDDNQTDKTILQIMFSSFDFKSYKMNYILPMTYDNVDHFDRKSTETKFQISFKKELTDNLFGLNEKMFLGYTQQSWWQTTADSSPFRETNYEPELFIIFPYKYSKSALKAYKIGVNHQSNGQSVGKSRSWNRIYASGIFQYSGFIFEPRVWYRLPEDEKSDPAQADADDNPDIHNYLGYGDLKINYPYKEHLFSLLLRNNLRFDEENRGAVQFDWTFPIPGVSDAYGYLQIFSGFGESLIDYDKRSDRIGLGFALTR